MDALEKEILLSREVIAKRVQELAASISRDYEGSELIVIGILKGAFIFMADLIRHLTIPCRIDFVRLASYGANQESMGKVIITKDIETSIKDRDVLVVEDIIDTGYTLSFLVDWLKERNPKSLKVCTLLDKRGRRKTPFEADYVGFSIDNFFVVGYGLDFDENDRNFADIYALKPLMGGKKK